MGNESQLSIKVHDCCGCSCDVCKDEHNSGMHTSECFRRFFERFIEDINADS